MNFRRTFLFFFFGEDVQRVTIDWKSPKLLLKKQQCKSEENCFTYVTAMKFLMSMWLQVPRVSNFIQLN
jgi:hypothetical protein